MFWRMTSVGGLLGLDLGLLVAIYVMGGVGDEGGDAFLFFGVVGFLLGLGGGAVAGSWGRGEHGDSSPRWLVPAMLGVVGLNVGLVLAIRPAGGGVSADSLSLYLTYGTVGLVAGFMVGVLRTAFASARRR